mmetsp:Transcript_21914/g.51220  ORF Transcript_21914/g.51220 Transcript_21914/m.51220 type:complete len:165 (-) Transcript_21914:41-535(-)
MDGFAALGPHVAAQLDRRRARFEGPLWKLNRAGDPMEEEDWERRDFWVTKDGSLAYQSMKENKPLALFMGQVVSRVAVCRKLPQGESCRPYTLELEIRGRADLDPTLLAADTEEEFERWFTALTSKEYRNNAARQAPPEEKSSGLLACLPNCLPCLPRSEPLNR